MSGNVVQMNYDRTEGVAKGFDMARMIVNAVAMVVLAQLEVMKASAFMAPPIVARITQWQQDIRQKTKTLSDKLEEMAKDLRDAINDHKRGDVAGKQYFMKGIRL